MSASAPKRRQRVRLVPWMVAGVQTQFLHLRKELERAGVEVSVSEVHPHVEGGRLERFPIPARARGTIRSVLSIRNGARRPADVVWSQVALPLVPHLVTSRWLRKAPVYYAIDCTPRQLFDFGVHYAGAATDPYSAKGRLSAMLLRRFFRRCTGLLPWSEWAARSMIDDYGADPSKVHVVPPGIDTDQWRPGSKLETAEESPRLLFVGGDFERKGGTLLLDLFRRQLHGRCSLDLVTRSAIAPEPGVVVHNGLAPDDPALLRLYQSADALVVPTYADCFSMSALEAMACGLPVITTPVGGIPEIVIEGDTGFLVPAGDVVRLREAIDRLISDPALRRSLGRSGRRRAVKTFDGATQARVVMDIMVGSPEATAGELRGRALSTRG